MLAFGTLIASVVGTTGAAMIVVRPLIRANQGRRHQAHVLVFAIFLIANSVPGDPVLLQLGDLGASNPIMVAAFRHKWGLDLPLWERYWIFLDGLLHGDLGNSIASRRPVLDDIADFAPATIELGTIAFTLALAVGLPLGVLAAVRRDSWIDHLARALSLVGVSAPTFWLAFIMLAIFYGALDLAPGPGRLDPIAFPPQRVTGFLLIDTVLAGDWDTFHDAVAHLVLPSIVLASGTLGLITRTTRKALASAFDTAWDILQRSGSTLTADVNAIGARGVLAARIIAMGRTGERDRQHLVNDALVHISNSAVISPDGWPPTSEW